MFYYLDIPYLKDKSCVLLDSRGRVDAMPLSLQGVDMNHMPTRLSMLYVLSRH